MEINVRSSDSENSVNGTPNIDHQPSKTKSKKRSKVSKKSLSVAVVTLLLLGLAGLAYYFYYQNEQTKKEVELAQNEINRLSDTEQVAKEERDELLNKVGQLVQLPQDETPTIATVNDISKLKNQPFFKEAQNGDKVLIYSNAKKAFLYRPSTNKVITIAPLNIGTANSQTSTNKSNQ